MYPYWKVLMSIWQCLLAWSMWKTFSLILSKSLSPEKLTQQIVEQFCKTSITKWHFCTSHHSRIEILSSFSAFYWVCFSGEFFFKLKLFISSELWQLLRMVSGFFWGNEINYFPHILGLATCPTFWQTLLGLWNPSQSVHFPRLLHSYLGIFYLNF